MASAFTWYALRFEALAAGSRFWEMRRDKLLIWEQARLYKGRTNLPDG